MVHNGSTDKGPIDVYKALIFLIVHVVRRTAATLDILTSSLDAVVAPSSNLQEARCKWSLQGNTSLQEWK